MSRLIVVEGLDGAGKSTLVKAIYDHIVFQGGQAVAMTREPGGTRGAEEIRSLLLSGSGRAFSEATRLLLNTAARQDHVERLIKPALKRGTFVICDRYMMSTLVFQVYCGVPENEDLFWLMHDSLKMPEAEYVFCDLNPEIAQRRIAQAAGETNHYDLSGKEKFQMRYDAYTKAAVAFCARKHVVHVVDASVSADKVLKQALEVLKL